MQKSERLLHLDILRMIACLSVVMIHVSAEFVIRGTAGADFLLGNLLDSLSRAGVPLFVMISGALMLDEGYVFTKKKWLSHIGRMSAFYLFWSVVYGLLNGGFSVALGYIFSSYYHLWFIPMLIGLYLLVPLLRLWVKEANVRYVEYFLLLAFIFAFIIPQIDLILADGFHAYDPKQTLSDHMNLSHVAGYPAYFILGWYLNREIRRNKLVCGLGIPGVAMTFIGTHVASAILHMDSYPFYETFTVNVLLHSAAVFVLCRLRFGGERQPGRLLKRLVQRAQKLSLGIYAVHIFIITSLMPLLGHLHAAIAIPLIFALTILLSAILSLIIRKIPLLQKIV